MLNRIFFLLFLLLPGLLPAQEPYKSHELAVTFPPSLAGMKLLQVTDYEKEGPGLGVGLSYRAENAKADLYIYTGGIVRIPEGVDSEEIQKHFKQVTGEVFEMGKRGYYSNVKIAVPIEKTKIGKHLFLHVEIHYTQNESRISHIYLTALNNRFLKIRYTYLASKPDEGKRIQQLLIKSVNELFSLAPNNTPRENPE